MRSGSGREPGTLKCSHRFLQLSRSERQGWGRPSLGAWCSLVLGDLVFRAGPERIRMLDALPGFHMQMGVLEGQRKACGWVGRVSGVATLEE